MKAGNGVALPVAVMAAVAAVVPVVVATTKQTVNMAAAMVTVTFFLWWDQRGRPHAGTAQSPARGIPLAQEACVRHQVSGHSQAPVG